jgi:imidazolonepropionase-like amidohydrolase
VDKLADLILLDANPLENIHNTQRIRAVIVQGRVLGRSALDQLLASVREFAERP